MPPSPQTTSPWRTLYGVIAVSAFLFAFLYVTWNVIYPSYSHSYRLTIEVETPEGLKSASSVIHVTAHKQPKLLNENSVVPDFSGEATFLDLGHGKNVVAVLSRGMELGRQDAPLILAMEAFGVRHCNTGSMCDWSQIERMSGARDLPPLLLPMLVTFSNPKNPKTARVIAPGEFAEIFGPGYAFKRAWIDITDAPVTRDIKSHLPWLEGFKGVTGGGPVNAPNPIGRRLTVSFFTR